MAKLESWDVDYALHVIAEFNCLDAPQGHMADRAQQLIAKFKQSQNNKNAKDGNGSEDEFQRSDLFELAEALLALQPTVVLLQRAPGLRQLYREVAGEKYFAFYKPAPPPPGDAADDSPEKRLFVADLQNVMSHLHWHYMLDPHRESIQRQLTINVIKMVGVYTCIWAAVIFANWYWIKTPFFSVLPTVIYAGIIGGFVSSLRRVQSVQLDQDSLFNIHTLNNSKYFLWLSPLLGSIFAVVLMLMFMSELISGPLFPTFEILKSVTVNPPEGWAFFKLLVPVSSADYATLFLWSFVAGFAERFVPDVLDRMIQRGQDAASKVGRRDSINNTPAPPGTPSQKASLATQTGTPNRDALKKQGVPEPQPDPTKKDQEQKPPAQQAKQRPSTTSKSADKGKDKPKES